MAVLRISLFGQMRVSRTEDANDIKLTHSIQSLLAYLLLKRGKFVSRDELVNLLWGECDQRKAHDCLNTALWRLRRKFRQEQMPGTEYLVTNYLGEVGFAVGEECWLDIVEFETKWRRTCESPHEILPKDVEDINRLIALYQGDLLEGFYEEWVVLQREQLRLMFINSLSRMMDYYHAHNNPRRSLDYGRRILESDPLREDIHRDIMRLYFDLGQRTMAIRQYRTCCKILEKELDIVPMKETQDLYECILSSSDSFWREHAPSASADRMIQGPSRDALRRVQIAVDSLEKARNNLDQAVQALEQSL
jgi:DNA-binding SARP family transcriptional activator